MIDPIITDQKVLHTPSMFANWNQVRELNLVERLKASNSTAWTKGVGLAAMQIGFYLRLIWFMAEGKDIVLLNPKIINGKDPIIVPKEGCLSIPDTWTATRRYHEITVQALQDGKDQPDTIEFKGFPAIVVQHEIDHLNGILNVQRRYIPPQVAGRNDPCPCGSGKKYKKCCIDKLQQPEIKEIPDERPEVPSDPERPTQENPGNPGE